MPDINIKVSDNLQVKTTQNGNVTNISITAISDPAPVSVTEPPKTVTTISSTTGKFDYIKALELTLYGQTWQVSGKKPAWSKNPHRGDCFLDDGQRDAKRDLSGGFHDAGDCIKVVTAAFSNCSQYAFAALFNKEKLKKSGNYEMFVNIIRHYCDWGIKCMETDGTGKTIKLWHWVSDNKIDHQCMLAPEQQEANYYKPKGLFRQSFAIGDGHEAVGEEPPSNMSACFALASMLLKDEDRAYSDNLLGRARSLYEFATKRRGKYIPHTVYPSSSYGDDICFAAIALHLATNDSYYLAEAEKHFDAHVKYPGWTWIVDNASSVATFLLAYATKKTKYVDMCKGWLDSWIKGTNGMRKHSNSPLRSNSDWGVSSQFGASAGLAIFAYKYLGLKNEEYLNISRQGMDYLLGNNAKGFSYLLGYGSNFPRNTHHRSLMNNKSLIGEGLWVSSEKADGFYQDKADDWITNENGCYNSALAMLLASLV